MDFITVVIYASIYIGLVATSFYALSFLSDNKKVKQLYADNELPFVSIILPAYNEQNSLEATVKSALNSDYPMNKFELIIVDDGSKDNTLKIAQKLKSKIVKVYTKENGGKGSALNFGIKRAKGEIIITMDADTYIEKQTVKNMMRFFKDKEVMSVCPAITVYNPKNLLQKIQHSEYLLGLFLRKAFSALNAVHITPGAFSAYRKTFFDKYGGYDVGNITEDLEMSLRIQYKGYKIEYCPEALVYTIAPNKFMHLLKQRRRWYGGLMKNMWKYKRMISPDYGDLGMFVIPIAWISIFFSVFVTVYLFFKTLFNVRDELLLLNSINFNFSSIWNISIYSIERFFFLLFTNPIIVFILIFMCFLAIYVNYAKKKIKDLPSLPASLIFFFLFFSILFGFWWIISIIYVALNKKISWK